ncbi:hypothetical protein M422DRAFT_88200, partial [Sphaerobolus stellatus SS14]
LYFKNHYEKTVQHDSILTGNGWLKELLKGNTNRICNHFGMCFHYVPDALSHQDMYKSYIKFPDGSECLPDNIHDKPKFYPFFKHALGEIDSSHILVSP